MAVGGRDDNGVSGGCAAIVVDSLRRGLPGATSHELMGSGLLLLRVGEDIARLVETRRSPISAREFVVPDECDAMVSDLSSDERPRAMKVSVLWRDRDGPLVLLDTLETLEDRMASVGAPQDISVGEVQIRSSPGAISSVVVVAILDAFASMSDRGVLK